MTAGLFAPVVFSLAAPPDFRAEVEAAHQQYAPAVEASSALLDEGKLDAANQALLDVVPDAKRTAAQWFLLGNLFFGQDFAKSYACHQKAYELAPAETMTQYEWALERHRRREYAEAETLYAKLEEAGGSDPRLPALRADCLLHLPGRAKDAVAAWGRADLRNRHTSIEQGFSWIYCGPHPSVKRCELLTKARGGDATAAEELILLDLEWVTDWWNSDPNVEHLQPDLKVAAAALGAETPRYRQLALLAEVTPANELDASTIDSSAHAAKLREKHLVGPDVPLPVSSQVATRILSLVERADVATQAELLQWYEKPLRARIEADPPDGRALESLAALYEHEKRERELAALESLGWSKLGSAGCVSGILARKIATLEPDDPLLKEALAKWPEDRGLRQIALQCAQRKNSGELEALIAWLEAHLAHMISWHDGAQAGFAALERMVGK